MASTITLDGYDYDSDDVAYLAEDFARRAHRAALTATDKRTDSLFVGQRRRLAEKLYREANRIHTHLLGATFSDSGADALLGFSSYQRDTARMLNL